MFTFLLRRLVYAALTAWVAFTLAFLALRILPGDAIAAQLLRSGATAAQIAERRAALGLDEPLHVQYAATLIHYLRGDFGVSLVSGRRVADMIGEPFGATLALAAGGLAVGLSLGLLLGIGVAVGPWRSLRWLAAGLTTLLLAAPVYWSGILAIYLFSVQLRWLPSAGGSGELRALLLPWAVLGLSLAGGIARLTGALLADVREADFGRTARAKGLRPRRVVAVHLLRPSFGPLITLVAAQAGFLIGGAVVTEVMFLRPGIGQILLVAVQDRDYPVVQGVVALSAALYSGLLAGADMLVAALDPRQRQIASG